MRVQVGGGEVYCYTGARPIDPSRPSVVFVHGAANDHSVFALQSRYFAHHGRNVLAVDLPGHGRSSGAPLDSVETIADWIARLLDATGVREAALVGHSLGALVALEAAARFPTRISRIALLGPAVPMTVSEALLDAARADDHVAFELIAGWSHSAGKQLGGNPVPGLWMMGNALRLMERSRPGALHVDLRACNEYANGIAAAGAVRCPALLIVGARDLMAPPKAAQALVNALAEKRVVTLPDCGHAMMAEQPDAVLDALAAFL
jgi:pimeloyl-ACP methyl ester carboxylesterase